MSDESNNEYPYVLMVGFDGFYGLKISCNRKIEQ